MPEKTWREFDKHILCSSNDGDITSRRQLAEELARKSGDASEEGVQRIMQMMILHDAARRVSSKEKLYKALSQLLTVVGFVCMVSPVMGMPVFIGILGAGEASFGFFFFILQMGEPAERVKFAANTKTVSNQGGQHVG